MSGAELPVLAFGDAEAFSDWIEANADAPGVALKLARKGSGIASVSRQEAIDVALCHGWIDGRVNALDGDHFLVRFTPRRRRSIWSEINRARALELVAEGRMKPAGLAEIERAQADGRWAAAYAPPSRAAVPDDLAAALARDAGARAMFERLDGRNRYAILHRIAGAKRPQTRAARIETFTSMLARGETIYPMRGR